MTVRVPAAEDMDGATFKAHYNLRHLGDLDSLTQLGPGGTLGGAEPAFRAYHTRCHRLYPERYDHVHRPPHDRSSE